MKILHLMKDKLDGNLKLLLAELLTNSGSHLDTTVENISRKYQLRRDETESFIRKLQKRGLAFISQGRFCLTPKGMVFVLTLIERGSYHE
uniref:ArnR1-like winged helix-turn-helix domain-containing protein n=1 Tax=Fervidobacterium pennivorans TaxID=93466 RepID=A0A7V4KEI6_FERPE